MRKNSKFCLIILNWSRSAINFIFVTTVQDVNGYDLKMFLLSIHLQHGIDGKTMGEQGKTVSVLEGDNWVEYSVTELITEYAIIWIRYLSSLFFY